MTWLLQRLEKVDEALGAGNNVVDVGRLIKQKIDQDQRAQSLSRLTA